MKFTLELEEEQMEVLEKALDMYSRMGMGQLDVAVEEYLRWNFFDQYFNKEYTDEDGNPSTRGEEVKDLVDRIKLLVFGHASNASWGIFSPQVPVASREAYDIRQKVRGALAQWRIDKARASKNDEAAKHILYSVDMDRYLPANPSFPPIKARQQAPSRKDAWEVVRKSSDLASILKEKTMKGALLSKERWGSGGTLGQEVRRRMDEALGALREMLRQRREDP